MYMYMVVWECVRVWRPPYSLKLQETAGIQSLLLSICLSIASHERGFEYKLKTVSQVFTPFPLLCYISTLYSLSYIICVFVVAVHIYMHVCVCVQ